MRMCKRWVGVGGIRAVSGEVEGGELGGFSLISNVRFASEADIRISMPSRLFNSIITLFPHIENTV